MVRGTHADDSSHSGLLADLYELTMAAGYFETHFQARATFELFVRSLPPRRNFLVAAGLEQALEFLESVRFSDDEIDYLRRHPAFAGIGAEFFDYLAAFRFSGDVLAMPEGTLCFPGEPLLRVTAPIAEAQIVETALLATMSFQTMIASKAARVVEAAAGRPVIEFGTRRAHGIESGVLAARAAYHRRLPGHVECAGRAAFGIPTYGTQAHSWIMAHRERRRSLRAIPGCFSAALRAACWTPTTCARPSRRLSPWAASRAACAWTAATWQPTAAGCGSGSTKPAGATWRFSSPAISTRIASPRCWRRARASTPSAWARRCPRQPMRRPSACFTSWLEIERDGQVRNAAKLSAAKVTYPGRKQVYRVGRDRGTFAGDVIALENETCRGRAAARRRDARGKARDPQRRRWWKRKGAAAPKWSACPPLRAGDGGTAYPVRYSARLEELLEQVRERVARLSPT